MERICERCGKALDENALFCAYCGSKAAPVIADPNEVSRPCPPPCKPPVAPPFMQKSRLSFCVAGFVLGLFALFFSTLPTVALFCAVLGIVFSAYGMKKVPAGSGRGFAIAGLILSIAACLVALLAGFVMLIELLSYSYYDYDPFYYDFDLSAFRAL